MWLEKKEAGKQTYGRPSRVRIVHVQFSYVPLLVCRCVVFEWMPDSNLAAGVSNARDVNAHSLHRASA